MSNEEIYENAKLFKERFIKEEEYNEWVEKCVKYYSKKIDIKDGDFQWNIILNNKEDKFKREVNFWGNLEWALLVFDVFYPQTDFVTLERYVPPVVIKEK